MVAKAEKSKSKAEFGDFQTPYELALRASSLLFQQGLRPISVLEPTCGKGNFLLAALDAFPTLSNAIGLDINGDYAMTARDRIEHTYTKRKVRVIQQDFFATDWPPLLQSLPDPLLIIGNPPWVTNAALGSLGSHNLPRKSNIKNHRGIDAITGMSNFDISEWMLQQALDWIKKREATIAVLCKTAVARKVLDRAWAAGQLLKQSHLYIVDTQRYFGASVDACFLVVESSAGDRDFRCQVHSNLTHGSPATTFGHHNGRLVADVIAFERLSQFEGPELYKWRSGIKHDCSKIMEFRKESTGYRNGMGELVDLEDNYVYPMLKSSDIANGSIEPNRWMLVTQRTVGEHTHTIRNDAPKTWEYLNDHGDLLDRRSSAIYRKKPRFSIFGVGGYSFAPWKVAISGFYKHLNFLVVGPHGGKPVVMDDTCYFVACETKEEAAYVAQLLNSSIAKEFFSAMIFWDAKRPVTASLLRRLDLLTVAHELGSESVLRQYLGNREENRAQMSLFTAVQGAGTTGSAG